jgi:hypothetical protein
MGQVNLQLVREFFELNLFHVLTPWKHDAATRAGDGAQLLVVNAHPGRALLLGQVIYPVDLPAIPRAVVEIRAWHGDRLYPSTFEASPVLTQFAEPKRLGFAREVFENQPFKTILVVSELPVAPEPRARVIQLLNETPVDHVLEFSSILRDILNKVNASEHYAGSVTLEMARILKRYGLIQQDQMEFGFSEDDVLEPSLHERDAAALEEPRDDEDE